jgi:proteic killer suppression protein
MIRNFTHKGLELFFLTGSLSGITASQSKRIKLILVRLHAATKPEDMALPGLHLHRLKGKAKQRWSVRLSGNWCITFAFNGADAVDIDYEDYH